MIALCTGQPAAKQDGERIIVTVPSGRGWVEIAFTFAEARNLGAMLLHVAANAVVKSNRAASAEVVRLKPKRRRKV